MTGTQLLRYQDRKIRFLEEEAKALQSSDLWGNGDRRADVEQKAAFIEQVVSDCLRVPEEMERLWKSTRQTITSGAQVDYQALGYALKGTFAGWLRLLTVVHGLGSEVSREAGRDVERLGELIDALATLRKMETRILSAWPWPDAPFSPVDMAMVEASRRSHDAGEAEELDDILARLKTGGDVTQEA